jgi:hypothetical protein
MGTQWGSFLNHEGIYNTAIHGVMTQQCTLELAFGSQGPQDFDPRQDGSPAVQHMKKVFLSVSWMF